MRKGEPRDVVSFRLNRRERAIVSELRHRFGVISRERCMPHRYSDGDVIRIAIETLIIVTNHTTLQRVVSEQMQKAGE